jgi:hypothetical protein
MEYNTNDRNSRKRKEYKILETYVHFPKGEIYKVFEALYGHEINLTHGWKWDLGYGDYMINDVLFTMTFKETLFQWETEAPDELWNAIRSRKIDWHDIGEAVSAMAYSAACLFYDQPYAEWYREEGEKRRILLN